MKPKHSGVAKLLLLNLFGNAALLACVYFWLLLPDARGWQVAVSGLLALLVIFFGLWLRAGTFAYFRVAQFRETAAVWLAFRQSLRHLLALAIWLIPFAAAEWGLIALRQYAPQFGVWFWQEFPTLRFGSPRQVYHAAEWFLWIVMVLLLAGWLPVASTVAAMGLRPSRMARSLRVLRRMNYWIWLVLLMFVGAYLPYKIVGWIPELSTLSRQAWSAGARFAFAYLLLVSAWVALLFVIGMRVEQEDSEPITASF